jgi:hypothetical protein
MEKEGERRGLTLLRHPPTTDVVGVRLEVP